MDDVEPLVDDLTMELGLVMRSSAVIPDSNSEDDGALLFGEDEFFSCGAYPLEDIHDPTGAGDTFAGGMAGYLAGAVKNVQFTDLRKAMIYGSVLASFTVEAFSLDRLRKLSMDEIKERYETFKLMSQFEVEI